MRPLLKLYLGIVMLLMLSVSVNAFVKRGDIEGIWLVRPETQTIDTGTYPPEYLELEDLVFYTCLEEENVTVTSTVICRDDNSFDDVTVYQWSDRNCFIADYDMSAHDCQNVIIRSTYELDDEAVTLEQEILENRLTTVMDTIETSQYSDGGWRDSMDTSYGVWAMSNFPTIYRKEIALGLDWLKEYRDNDEKCWPRGTCSPRLTANILGMLTYADFNTSLRVMHDGLIWLERNQNYYTTDDVWTVNVTPYWNNLGCLNAYGSDYNQTVNISVNSSFLFNVTPEYPKQVYVICTDSAKVTIRTEDGEEVLYYEGDNMSFFMPGAGWANGDRWSDADVATTVWALMTNISQPRKDVALAWLVDELRLEGNKGKYLGADRNISSSALYLAIVNNSPISEDYDGYDDINYSFVDVLQWVRFKQNNNGSWGSGNQSTQIAPTGNAVISLLEIGFNRSDEVINDAEEWVSENELATGWNTTQKNAYAFFVLKNNARPFLKTDPRIIIMDRPKVTVEIYNPTTYDLNDLRFEFSDELKGLLDIESQDGIREYSYIRVDISQRTSDLQDSYGYLYIMNGDENVSTVPVMVVSFPAINITPVPVIQVFGTRAQAKFTVVKTSDTFKCVLSWDDEGISSQSDFTIVNQAELVTEIKFTRAERLEKSYTGDFICSIRDKSFLIPFSTTIDRYPSYPISVSPDKLFVNSTGQDVSFIVKNLLDETIDVSIAFQKSEDFFDIEKSKLVLNPSEERNITIFNIVPVGFNVTTSNTIQVSALGQTESIRFLADVMNEGRAPLNPIVFWSLIGLLVVILGAGGYIVWNYRAQIANLFKPGTQIDDVKNRIRKLEDKGTSMAIMNYARMLRFQGKKDKEIREKLLSEGFKPEEVDKAFKGDETQPSP